MRYFNSNFNHYLNQNHNHNHNHTNTNLGLKKNEGFQGKNVKIMSGKYSLGAPCRLMLPFQPLIHAHFNCLPGCNGRGGKGIAFKKTYKGAFYYAR